MKYFNGLFFPYIQVDALETFAYRHAMITGTVSSFIANIILLIVSYLANKEINYFTYSIADLGVAIFSGAYGIWFFSRVVARDFQVAASSPVDRRTLLNAIKHTVAGMTIFAILAFFYETLVSGSYSLFSILIFIFLSAYLLGGYTALCFSHVLFNIIRITKSRG